MTAMTDAVRLLLVRELEAFAREIEMFPTDDAVWRTVPGITNSAGNLALHVCGNLKHFVGAVLGNSGYIRDRDAEFSRTDGNRSLILREIRETIDVVSRVLPELSEATLEGAYPQRVAGVEVPCGRWLMHLCAHLAFHLGQAGYLRRMVTRENRNSGAVPVPVLAQQ
jgi:hypothetical protein